MHNMMQKLSFNNLNRLPFAIRLIVEISKTLPVRSISDPEF